MSFGFQIGDAIALTQLAVDLYQRGFKVAKAAPDSFRDLLDYLLIYRNLIWRIQAQFAEDGRLQDETALATLRRSQAALNAFRPLVAKYQNLASTHRGSFLRRLQFPFDVEKISTCKEEIKSSIQILDLYLRTSSEELQGTPDNRSSTEYRVDERRTPQIPTSNPTTLEPASRPAALPEPSPRIPLPFNQSAPQSSLTFISSSPPRQTAVRRPSHLQQVQRIDTLRTDDASDDGLLHPVPVSTSVESPQIRRLRGFSATDSGESAGTTSSLYGDRSSSTSIPSTHEDTVTALEPRQATKTHTANALFKRWFIGDGDEDVPFVDQDNVMQIDVEHRADTLRKLDIDLLSEQLVEVFEKRAEAMTSKMDTEAWLLRAVWYLCKAREVHHAVGSMQDQRRMSRTEWPAKISLPQACADFLKGCYIVKHIIFKESAIGSDITYTNWKTVQDLTSCLHEIQTMGLEDYFQVESSRISEQDLNFYETFCPPLEEARRMPNAMDTFTSPNRWLTVEMDDSGHSDERVHFRTFVNAKIGKERERMRSTTAPYMLLLWSQRARSEMIVSLINQHGTVNLQSSMTADDLQRHDDQARSGLEFVFTFPSQAVVMQFLCQDELEEFLRIPRHFFAAMDDRDARPEEFLVFRIGLQSFDSRSSEVVRRASVSENLPTKAHMTCELSLYEQIPNECWKTVRRLVISSAPDAPKPWCVSYWLPLSRVQVHAESREVELSWSDCSNLEKKSTGNYDYRWSYVYRPDHPNFTISLQFENDAAAEVLSHYILHPFETPFNLPNLVADPAFGSETKRTQVWRIRDLDEVEPEEYLAITSTDRRPNSKTMSEILFVHRDLDFSMGEIEEHVVQIPNTRVPHYVSDLTGLAWEPTSKDGIPKFTAVEWAFKSAKFGFANDEDMARFVKSIIGWDLIFTCTAETVAGIPKTQHHVVLALWQKENPDQRPQLKLTIRHTHRHEVTWTTATLDNAADCSPQRNSSKMIIKDVNIQQGSLVDITSLRAHDPKKQKQKESKKTKLTITLPDAIAVQQMDQRIAKCLGDWLPTSDLVYRTRTAGTSVSRGSHGRTSHSAGSRLSMDNFKIF